MVMDYSYFFNKFHVDFFSPFKKKYCFFFCTAI